MRSIGHIFFTTVTMLLFAGCKPDPVPENPEQLITTVRLMLETGSQTHIFQWTDLDGDGGSAPEIIKPDSLPANTTFTGTITIINQLAVPTVDVTQEVIEEGAEHQLFYIVSPDIFTLEPHYSVDDIPDENGRNIGIVTIFQTGSAAENGSLRIVLKHEPQKDPQSDIEDPDGAGGETDLDITFSNISIR